VDASVDLLGGRVLASAAQLTQDDHSLGGHPLPAPVEQLNEIVRIGALAVAGARTPAGGCSPGGHLGCCFVSHLSHVLGKPNLNQLL
jgi:hypothetical protein